MTFLKACDIIEQQVSPEFFTGGAEMTLYTNLQYLSERKNPKWNKNAVKLIECYEKKQTKRVPEILAELNNLFQNNNLPQIAEKNFDSEFRDFITKSLGKY